MPIIFDNSADPKNITDIPPQVVGEPKVFQLLQNRGASITIFRDGNPVGSLNNKYEKFEADVVGEYTFTLSNDCGAVVVLDCGVMFSAQNGTFALDTAECSSSGTVSESLNEDISDGVGDSMPPFPADYLNATDTGAGGRPFAGFPFVSEPVGRNAGFSFTPTNSTSPSFQDCESVSVTRLAYEIDLMHISDSDGQDLGDVIGAISISGSGIPTSGSSTSGVVTSLGVFQFLQPVLNDRTTLTVEAQNPSSISIQDAFSAILLVANQAGDSTEFSGFRRILEYDVVSRCTQSAVLVQDCNSSQHLDALNRIEQAIINSSSSDFEYDFQPWIRSSDSGTWVRSVVVFENGSIRTDLGQIVDSGIPIDQPSPSDSEYISSTQTLCNAEGEWTVLNVFDTNDTSTPFSTAYLNPFGIVQPDPGDLVACNNESSVDLGPILSEIQLVVSNLQSLNSNTDGLEPLATLISTAVTTEGNESQAILQLILDSVDGLESLMTSLMSAVNANQNFIDITPNPDQTHIEIQGSNTSVPAGLKSVVISNLSGVTSINGGFEIGDGRRPKSFSVSATELERARGLLPEYILSGGTWQWIGLQPIGEV